MRLGPTGPRWRLRAACREEDPNLFFPDERREGRAKSAKAICSTCCVKEACLYYALANSGLTGIWAGTTTNDRALLRERLAG